MSNYDLIVNGLQEVIGREELRKISEQRAVRVYWGTAPTGRVHMGYYTPLLKIAELVKAGCEVTILIADLHAILDSQKSTEKQVQNRSEYYTKVIKCMLTRLDVDLQKVRFVRGMSFQLSPEYTMDMYRLNTLCDIKTVQNAGEKVVNQYDIPVMTSLMYPTLQALDEEYLHVDAQLGSINQREIFMFAREYLPKLGYNRRIHLLCPAVRGLRCMDRVDGLLDMLDSRSQIKNKVGAAYCLPGDTTDNSVLDILNNVLFPLLKHLKKDFVIFRREEHGGPITFADFEDVCKDYKDGVLHPTDLKAGVSHNLDMFIEPVRKEFESREWRQIVKHAYD